MKVGWKTKRSIRNENFAPASPRLGKPLVPMPMPHNISRPLRPLVAESVKAEMVSAL